MNDTSDHDQARFASAGNRPGMDTDGGTRGRASLETVDFDVTAGFGDEAPAAEAEFIDLTQGADAAAAAVGSEDFLDLTGEAAAAQAAPEPVPAAVPPAATAPPPTPAPDAAAGGGGKLALIGAIVAALVAAALWYALR